MFIVGFFMLVSAVLTVLTVLLARSNRISPVHLEQVTPTPEAVAVVKDDVR